MVITTDVILKGKEWQLAKEKLSHIFKKWPHYMLFYLSLSIGILYDQRISEPDDNGEEPIAVPRTVLHNNASATLDYFFQAAILTSDTVPFTENERLELAFADESKIVLDKMRFLTEFANYGITVLVQCIGESELESMDNIKNFLASTIEGTNLDIFEITEDMFDEEDLD